MNTLDDLYRTFDTYAAHAPDSTGLVEQARAGAARRRIRRRWQGWLAGAAVLALAGSAPLAVAALRPDRELPRTPAQLSLSLDAPFAAAEHSGTGGTESLLTANVLVQAGPLTLPDLRTGRTLRVAGHDARATSNALGWPLPSGGWVTVSNGDEATRVLVAEHLHTGPPRDVPVPWRAGWLPTGAQVSGTRLTEGVLVRYALASRVAEGWLDSPLAIEAVPLSSSQWSTDKRVQYEPAQPVNGRPALRLKASRRVPGGNDGLAIETPTCAIAITFAHGATDYAALRRIAASLTVADCTDRSTWSPAR
ncbi:hypothetical protein [Actinoplanes sp. N902-109]|uniref:hypothetical protein n=1 Tax=Actinoplanes sp. (strain N902-109) TaxID=649831 RepID=UPI000329454C|nr:hypothetical protein [Actinoplanes sp. N902-109]AGL19590.1 hypothetical protein L083_6080 [Actinoplanes sp. N902-109]